MPIGQSMKSHNKSMNHKQINQQTTTPKQHTHNITINNQQFPQYTNQQTNKSTQQINVPQTN